MKRALLTLRFAVEAIFGLMFVINGPISIWSALNGHIHGLLAITIVVDIAGVLLGIFLMRDADRVSTRVKAMRVFPEEEEV